MKWMKNKTTKDTEGLKIEFIEGLIQTLHKKALKNSSDLKLQMKFLAQVCRRILHHYSETIEEFVPVALLLEKEDKIFVLSKDKIKKEITIKGFSEFMKLYPGLKAPKIIHSSEINKIEKMLEKDDGEEKKDA